MDDEFKIVEEYYKTVKPACDTELSEYCILLTKLTQEEINSSHDAVYVIDEIISILEKYNIKEVYCYGGDDAHSLRLNFYYLKKAGIRYENIYILIKRIRNIQPCLTKCFKIGMSMPMRLSGLCDILSLNKDDAQLHNALYDAKMLGNVYKAVFYENCKEHTDYLKYLESKK